MATSPARGPSGPKEVIQGETRPAERGAVQPAKSPVHGEYLFRTPELKKQAVERAVKEAGTEVLNRARGFVDSAKEFLNPSEEKPQEAPPKPKAD